MKSQVIVLLAVVACCVVFVRAIPLGVDSEGSLGVLNTLEQRDIRQDGMKRLRTDTFLHEFVQKAKKNHHQRTENRDWRVNLDDLGRLTVRVTVTSITDGTLEEVSNYINSNGGEVIATLHNYVEAVITTEQFEALHDMEDKVVSIRTIPKPKPRIGSALTQAAAALLVNTNVQRSNFTGSGVTIGVISDSVNRVDGGLSESIGTGDLPSMSRQQVLKDGPATGATDEARAMAEIIYDIASGVNFKYYCPTTPADMANGVKALANAGCKVIVDDLGFFGDAFYSDGTVATAVNAVVNNQKVAYFSAAGNSWGQTYEAAYSASPAKTFKFSSSNFQYASCHLFPSGLFYQPTTTGTGASIVLQWNQRVAAFGGGSVDLDLLVADYSTNPPSVLATSGVTDGTGSPVDPVEFAGVDTGSSLIRLSICSVNAAPSTTRVMLVFNDIADNMGIGEPSSGNAYPSIFGHPQSSGAIAIATADYTQTCRASWVSAPGCSTGDLPLLETYSSSGGLRVFFDSNGNPLPDTIRKKPDLTGVDCGDTSFFGQDTDDDGKPNFCGTSAAAPAVAAIGTLMLQKCPGSTPTVLRTALASGAKDMYSAGFDYDAGYGLVNGQLAIQHFTCSGGSPTRTKTRSRSHSRTRSKPAGTHSRTPSKTKTKSRTRSKTPSRSPSKH